MSGRGRRRKNVAPEPVPDGCCGDGTRLSRGSSRAPRPPGDGNTGGDATLAPRLNLPTSQQCSDSQVRTSARTSARLAAADRSRINYADPQSCYSWQTAATSSRRSDPAQSTTSPVGNRRKRGAASGRRGGRGVKFQCLAYSSRLRDEFDDSDKSDVTDEVAVEDDPYNDDSDTDEFDWTGEIADASAVDESVARQRLSRRPATPDFIDVADLPQLVLPPSSDDLVVGREVALQVAGIYEVLRHFSSVLRLSPFRFEDFCAALVCSEQCCLLAETHVALLKAILREEDANDTMFSAPDTKDSVNISLYFADPMTWFECIREYLESFSTTNEFQAKPICAIFDCNICYQDVDVGKRLLLLQTFTDLFLTSSAIRDTFTKDGEILHEEKCRYCHRYVRY